MIDPRRDLHQFVLPTLSTLKPQVRLAFVSRSYLAPLALYNASLPASRYLRAWLHACREGSTLVERDNCGPLGIHDFVVVVAFRRRGPAIPQQPPRLRTLAFHPGVL